jgi:hypothetical protein
MLLSPSTMHVNWTQSWSNRQFRSTSYVLVVTSGACHGFLTLSTTDVPDSRSGHGVNCCDKDVSLPHKLSLARCVRRSPFHPSTLSVFGDCSSSRDGLQRPSRIVSGPKQLVFVEPIELNRTKVQVYTTSEQFLESQAGQCGLSEDDEQTA